MLLFCELCMVSLMLVYSVQEAVFDVLQVTYLGLRKFLLLLFWHLLEGTSSKGSDPWLGRVLDLTVFGGQITSRTCSTFCLA